jgi:hypothetical protein
MAVQNLEIAVDVNISSAISALRELQNELENLADEINKVDARGAEGIDINTHIESIDGELATVKSKMEAFEATQSLDIGTNIGDAGRMFDFGGGGADPFRDLMGAMFDQDLDALSGADLPGDFAAPRGRPGLADPDFLSLAQADLDFGGFNVPRGQGREAPDRRLRMLRRFGNSIKDTLGELDDFKLRMSDLHNLMAGLIPMLLVFLGAIPTAVTAIITLAAAAVTAAASLAAIAGFGALGAAMEGGEFQMSNLEDIASDIRDDFLEAFAPLADRLEPLFMDGLDGLERFFQAIANQGDALVTLTDEARGFGQFLMDFFPQVLRTAAGLVEALAPVFGELGGFLQNNLNDIVRTFLDITLEALPALIRLAHNIAGVLRFLARMGEGFAVVSSFLLEFFGAIGLVLNAIGLTDQQLGLLLGSLFSFISLLAIANFLMNSFAVKAIAKAITALYGFWLSTVQASTGLSALTVSGFLASAALASLLTIASLGVLAGLGAAALGVAQDFIGMADSIDAATNSMKEFNRVSGRAGPEGNPFAGAPDSGAAASGTSTFGGGGGGATINVESTGDKNKDNSNAQKAQWHLGRTSGDRV